MKTVLIDRSLVGMNYIDNPGFSVDKKAMFMYAQSLCEAGAAYVEVDFEAVMRLPKPSGAENYIYRLSSPEEFVVANALNFAYAVVPLAYSYVLSRLELPVILEIDTGDVPIAGGKTDSIGEILRIVSSNIDFSMINMIRLTGDFEPDLIPEIIGKYRRRLVIPIDICPCNNRLTALSSVVAAYQSNSDAVTVSFADNEKFASLEEVLIMLSAIFKIIVCPDYLEGICKASLFSSMICEEKVTNLSMMMRKYMYCPLDIENIDNSVNNSPGRPLPQAKKHKTMHPAARVLYSMGIEREMSDSIIKVLESSNMEISGNFEEDDKELQ